MNQMHHWHMGYTALPQKHASAFGNLQAYFLKLLLRVKSSEAVIPIWSECIITIHKRSNLGQLQLYWLASALMSRCDWKLLQEVKRRLVSSYGKRRGRQAVQLQVGGIWGQDCTTWIRHCSTCLLISSSLPAKGALHSGHTCPPSSGFLLFIFPIRAGKQQSKDKDRQKIHQMFQENLFQINLPYRLNQHIQEPKHPGTTH